MCNNVPLHFDHMLRIQDLGFHVIKNLYTHPDRKLNWDVFLYVADGQMEVWEDNKEYVINKGQFLFLKSGLHHWGEPKTPAGTSWYWIHFFSNPNTETSQELNVYLNSYPSHLISHEDYSKFIKLPKQGSISHPKKLEKKLDSFIRLFHSTDPYRAITLSLQTMELFVDIFEESIEKYPRSKSDRTVQRIIEYLEQKDGYSLDSQAISSSLDMNYSYLCEVFKTKTGSTIHMYNSHIFIDKAIGLMSHSNRNISEISELLGFKNPFYFSRVFRKIMGCAPSEYMCKIYRE
ncbi:AraC family transcriptional regulator [Cohnella sp. REN36]|uniref:AraC family transcriptional regulator n=1 Tax=Cohnella sp. REN36 TaxID=2887347 RepID=UPI001D13AE94|nr:AraC family transcriptional regulator [Cohnella sp. REN36]MCC3372442.1 AraC family transcriptional regulator [Cohnella sp. REN36]